MKHILTLLVYICCSINILNGMEDETTVTPLRQRNKENSSKLLAIETLIRDRNFEETQRWLVDHREFASKNKENLEKIAANVIEVAPEPKRNGCFPDINTVDGYARLIGGITGGFIAYLADDPKILIPITIAFAFDGFLKLIMTELPDNESQKNALAIKTLITDLKED
ncbi:MAG: hypothetical protein BWY54_00861 [Candidatus Dependentiae bacterium ADurb.Bin331]|nr:MAG: hypothetical protein BWY54_00861 [Candidatus Dependentiae bacterium ADurb.Bin331]